MRCRINHTVFCVNREEGEMDGSIFLGRMRLVSFDLQLTFVV